MRLWLLRFAIVLVLAGAMAGGAVLWANRQLTLPGPGGTVTTLVIPRGARLPEIAEQLQTAGVVGQGWLFLLATRLAGKPSLKAGEYAFPAHASLAAVIDMMHRGQVVVHKVTLAEGLTVAQILAELRQAEGLAGPPAATPEEGTLLPETYHYMLGDSRDSILARMSRSMTETLDDLWGHRQAGTGLENRRQALILASIVERETALAEERPHVAAVFLNRLRLHMKLQSDPTVIYAVSQGEGGLDRPLSHDDLALASPYNTYLVDGLPPAPICNPGRASLQAVLEPAPSEDLYFVADGTGGHVFAKTLAEHNRNVAKWRSQQKAAHAEDGVAVGKSKK